MKNLAQTIAETRKLIVDNKVDAKVVDALLMKVQVNERRGRRLLAEVLPSVMALSKGAKNPDYLNKAIQVLSPANRAYAIQFFSFYSPFGYRETKKDKRVKLFGKVKKGADLKHLDEIWEDFLSLNDEGRPDPESGLFGGSYWLWCTSNLKVKNVNPDYVKLALKAVHTACKKSDTEDDDISVAEMLIDKIIDEEGVNLASLLKILNNKEAKRELEVDGVEVVE